MSVTHVDDEDDDEEARDRAYAAIRELPEAVNHLRKLKAEKESLEAEILFVENWIDNAVKESTIVLIDGVQWKATPIRGTQTNVNVKRFERLLPEVAARVIKTEEVTKVDNAALVKEIELGNVPVKLMAQFIEQKPKKTSIRLTEVKPREEEEEHDQE